MSLENIRRRLEALNRQPLPTELGSEDTASNARHRVGARTDLEALIDGSEWEAPAGPCYRVLRRLARSWPSRPDIGARLGGALHGTDPGDDRLDPDLVACVEAGVEALLFVDLETCGFAGTPVFLVGTLYHDGTDLIAEQLLARTYEEESAIVARVAQLAADRRLLITFNGKTFDWPFLRDRASVHRIDLVEPVHHCDLLHVVRRRYRHILPDCKLQTLEVFVCRRRRQGDIAGADIPAAYHDYVRTGDARLIKEVVHHNYLDLVTLADLLIDRLGG
ncbi:MAG: ribonuclease H-like domain-containing protein [Phycisphaerae bacterium]